LIDRGRAASFEVGPAVVVFAAAFLAYAANLGNGFVYDDRFVVERNPLVQSLDFWGLVSTSYWGEIVDAGLYRPLTLLSFGVNRALGASPFGFHLVNDLLHAFASVLLLMTAGALGLSRAGSLAAGLLFALHPVQSEAVEAIVGRADILAVGFTLGAMVLFLRKANPLLVGASFLLALLSKESAAFAIPLFAVLGSDAFRLASVGGAAAFYLGLRRWALGGLGIGGREIGFLDNPLADAGLAERLLAAPALLLHYVKLVLWPRVLSADYSYDQIPIPAEAIDLRVLLGVAALALVLFFVLRRGLTGFAALAFLVPLLGCLHLLFPLGTLFAERLLYLPMIGAALGFGLVLPVLLRIRALGAAVLVVVAAASAVRLQARHRDWRDNETLFRRTVATSPASARSHFLLGAELLEKKEFQEAAGSFQKGLAIYPGHYGARMSLGQALFAAGDAAAAEAAFRLALEIEPRSEDARRGVVESALAVGRARARAEDFGAARESFERALAVDPEEPSAWNYLGLVSERSGRTNEARRDYERALEIDPEHVPALVNLASVRMSAGELKGAEETYRRALALAPDSYEAWNGLGIALARQGRRDEAAEAFERAIAIEPELEAARENLRALR
jgi:tetratricopeptide (TPR) repeat protein